jgi:translation initiation factor 1
VSESRLVYSTEGGDHRGEQRVRPAAERSRGPRLPDDGVVRVFREKGGRRGKTVTVVHGLAPGDLGAVAGDLKRHCGTGGSVKGGAVELQGDHREQVAARLESRGYRVKLAGG